MKLRTTAVLLALAAGAAFFAGISYCKQARADEIKIEAPVIIVIPAPQPRKLTIQERVAKSVAAANRAGAVARSQHNRRRLYELRAKQRR